MFETNRSIWSTGESGWSPDMVNMYVARLDVLLLDNADEFLDSARPNARSPEHSAMEKLLTELQGHTLAFAFQKPVDKKEVLDYYDVIKEPMGTAYKFLREELIGWRLTLL